jgi:ubiquinone/menaquinone biosynthesis C-methylase UbiE
MSMSEPTRESHSPVVEHYATGYEKDRLGRGSGRLERARTEEILTRYLPAAPADVVDIGGGAGVYAAWLAARGYRVELLDIVPLHVEQARQAFAERGLDAARARVGDALRLPFAPESADCALLLGPLYHLLERADRLTALREAWRVVRPGGTIAVAAISRFASLLDGFFRGFSHDPSFVAIVREDLASGRHRNITENPSYFTHAYFHHPREVPAELVEAGFVEPELLAVEGPFWCLQNFDEVWASAALREHLLGFLRQVERDESLIGASAHLLALARKPA